MQKIYNPVLKGFNPDPSICFACGAYYIATSTFEYFGGVRIYKSFDLANWEFVCCPLNDNLVDLMGNDASCGVWAPCLSYDNGLFYLVFSNVRTWAALPFKDVRNYITTAKQVDSVWSDPVYVNSSGFDASLFHDDDGKKWFVNMEWDYRSKDNMHSFSGILLQEYDETTQKLIGNPKKIFLGTDLIWLEAPHIFKRNGYYYLVTAEGGTSYEHASALARSKTIDGEYELHPLKHMLTSNKINCYLQKSGRGSFCKNDKDEWFFAHLCARPVDGSMRCILGRETAIQNIVWKDEWAYIKGDDMSNKPRDFFEIDGEAIIKPKEAIHYIFDDEKSIKDFQTLRIDLKKRGILKFNADKKCLILKGRESLYSKHIQSSLLRRQEDFTFESELKMKFSPNNFQQLAGLVYRYNEANAYFLYMTYDENKNSKILAVMSVNNSNCIISAEQVEIKTDMVYLKIEVSGAVGQFLYSLDGVAYNKIGEKIDASILSDEYATPMGFTGAFVGMCCIDMQFNSKCAEFYEMTYVAKNEFSPKFMREEG